MVTTPVVLSGWAELKIKIASMLRDTKIDVDVELGFTFTLKTASESVSPSGIFILSFIIVLYE